MLDKQKFLNLVFSLPNLVSSLSIQYLVHYLVIYKINVLILIKNNKKKNGIKEYKRILKLSTKFAKIKVNKLENTVSNLCEHCSESFYVSNYS